MALFQQRDVGKLGESELEKLCHQVGITVNKVQEDETGWDHLLEFPSFPKHSTTF